MLLDPSNEYHYDLMSAMRGPDDQSDNEVLDVHVKSALTAPLRHMVGVSIFGPVKHSVERAITEWNKLSDEKRARAAAWLERQSHYRTHLTAAADALRYLSSTGGTGGNWDATMVLRYMELRNAVLAGKPVAVNTPASTPVESDPA